MRNGSDGISGAISGGHGRSIDYNRATRMARVFFVHTDNFQRDDLYIRNKKKVT